LALGPFAWRGWRHDARWSGRRDRRHSHGPFALDDRLGTPDRFLAMPLALGRDRRRRRDDRGCRLQLRNRAVSIDACPGTSIGLIATTLALDCEGRSRYSDRWRCLRHGTLDARLRARKRFIATTLALGGDWRRWSGRRRRRCGDRWRRLRRSRALALGALLGPPLRVIATTLTVHRNRRRGWARRRRIHCR
jgi:hypothetical protein